MKIYFEDGQLMHSSLVPADIDFEVCASKGVSQNMDFLDMLLRRRPNCTIYTNSIFALNNMYTWNEELGVHEVYVRTSKNSISFTRIDELTHRELRRGHNIARMYVAGEFGISTDHF